MKILCPQCKIRHLKGQRAISRGWCASCEVDSWPPAKVHEIKNLLRKTLKDNQDYLYDRLVDD